MGRYVVTEFSSGGVHTVMKDTREAALDELNRRLARASHYPHGPLTYKVWRTVGLYGKEVVAEHRVPANDGTA